MPYLWAASLKGTVTARGVESKVDASFSDILHSLKYAAMGQVELSKGRGLILADTLLLKTEVDGSVEKSRLGPLGLVRVRGEVDADVETLTWFQELMGGYRVYERELGSDCEGPRRLTVDALAGIRY